MSNRFFAAIPPSAPSPPPHEKPKRTRQRGIVKAVLRVLEAGPCPVSEVMAWASIQAGAETVSMGQGGPVFYRPVYSRPQVLAALRYAARRGYVRRLEYSGVAVPGGLEGPTATGRWLVMPSSVSQRMYEAQAPPAPQPGGWCWCCC